MNTASKKAIALEPGDHVHRIEGRPNINLYRGVVRNTVVVDNGLQVNYVGGMHVTLDDEDTLVEVTER